MKISRLNYSFLNIPIFENFSLQIQPEKITLILGPSGCGKSTLLKILSGINPLNLKSDQIDLPEFPTVLQVETLKSSYVFQDSNLLPWLTAEQNITLPCRMSSQNERQLKLSLESILNLLKIEDCKNLFPAQLSGGQKMRVSIARALITSPKTLFMDEPFSALDEVTRLNLQDELKSIQQKQKMTILFVTHSLYEAVYLADRLLLFSRGRPSQIVHDEILAPECKVDRFSSSYQNKVQQLKVIYEAKT